MKSDVWRVYWHVLADWRGGALLVTVLFGLSGLMEGVALLAMGRFLDLIVADTTGGGSGIALGYLDTFVMSPLAVLATFAACGVLGVGLRWAGELLNLRLRRSIEMHSREVMTRALLAMNWPRFVALRHGDIAKSFLVEGMQIAAGASLFLLAISAGAMAGAYLLTAFYISTEMTTVTLLFALVGAVAYKLAGRQMQRHARRLSQVASGIGEQAGDIFGNLKFFRASGATRIAHRKASKLFEDYSDAYFRTHIFAPGLRAGFEVGAILFIVAFFYWRHQIVGDAVTAIVVFLAVFYRLAPRILALQDGLFQSASYLSWYRDWRNRLDHAQAYPQPEAGERRALFDHMLSMRDVAYAYPDAVRPALININFDLRPGECVALVGSSGSGKSTLLDIITGLLVPQEGTVLLDDTPLSAYDLDSWRSQLGLVLQDSPMFYGTILENIAWGYPVPDRQRALEAAQRAHAWEFIALLPDQFETVIGERGAKLSGGQRQRIAIARALYRNPHLLILDEATSALDGESEEAIQQVLQSLRGDLAILIVAHRLKTVAIAERIYVMEAGCVAESGDWASLMERNGKFASIVRCQALSSD